MPTGSTGTDAALTFAGSQGHFELNVFGPMMAYKSEVAASTNNETFSVAGQRNIKKLV